MAGVKGMKWSRGLNDEARCRVKTTEIINRLQGHVLGSVEMSKTQISAALGLLRKTLPDLSSVEHSGEVAIPNVIRAPHVEQNTEQWRQRYAPPTIQ